MSEGSSEFPISSSRTSSGQQRIIRGSLTKFLKSYWSVFENNCAINDISLVFEDATSYSVALNCFSRPLEATFEPHKRRFCGIEKIIMYRIIDSRALNYSLLQSFPLLYQSPHTDTPRDNQSAIVNTIFNRQYNQQFITQSAVDNAISNWYLQLANGLH